LCFVVAVLAARHANLMQNAENKARGLHPFKGLASGVNGPGLRSLKGEAGALSSSVLSW